MEGDKGHVGAAYLESAAQILEPVKASSDRLLDCGPGATIVDVGCGLGLDALRLARSLCPDGGVVGVDADPVMVQEARKRIRQANLEDRVRFEVGTASRLPLDSASADACRSDRLLMHLAAPDLAVGEMARVIKAGGRVVCVEPDWATLSIDCESAEVERRLAGFTAETALNFGFAGRRLLTLMTRAGLTETSVEVHAVAVLDYRLASYLVCFDRVHASAIEAGLVTQEELDHLYEELELAQREDRFYGSLNLVVASGRKRGI